jgi:putative transposase
MASKKSAVIFVRNVPLRIDTKSAAILDGQSKICNRLHNDLMDVVKSSIKSFSEFKEKEAIGLNDEEKTQEQKLGFLLYTPNGLRDLVPGIKDEHPFYKAVASSPLKNVARRLSRAIRSYQDSKTGKRKGPKIGFPDYKSWKKDWYSLEYEERKGWSVERNVLKMVLGVDKDGNRIRLDLPLENPPRDLKGAKGVRIVKFAGRYRAIFTIEKVKKPSRQMVKVAYIDPNLKNIGHLLGTDGNSITFENTDGIKDIDRRIDRIKSKRDHCKRRSTLVEFQRDDGSVHRHWDPSPRWRRFDDALKRAEEMRRDRIKHHLYGLGNFLYRHYDVVGIGDFTPANADSGLGKKANRTIRNGRYLGKFRGIMTWLATRSGKHFYVRDEKGTTRTCSDCQAVVEGGIHPSIREWNCEGCGVVHDRDENASKNGLVRFVNDLVSDGLIGNLHVPCSGPFRPKVASRCRMAFRPGGRWKVVPVGANASMNQIAAPDITEAVGESFSDRRDSRRPCLQEADSQL